MAEFLEAVGAFFYALALRRWSIPAAVGVGLASVLMIAFGRIEAPQPVPIQDLSLDQVGVAQINAYVRVTGTLVTARAHQTRFQLGPLTLRGSRFVPVTAPGVATPLYVLDEGIPGSVMNSGNPNGLLGRIVAGTGTQQPAFYLQVSTPPTLLPLSVPARFAIGLLLALWLMLFCAWLLRRWDYAIELPASSIAPHPGTPRNLMLWFGELGRDYDSAVLRHTHVTLNARAREARLNMMHGDDVAAISVLRRLFRTDHVALATRYGALPALRIEFEDERGIIRRASLAFGSDAARTAVIEVLNHVGRIG